MKKRFLPSVHFLLFLTASMLLTIHTTAQKKAASSRAFAFTSEVKGSAVWDVLRVVNLQNGDVLQSYNLNTTAQPFDAASGKAIASPQADPVAGVDFLKPAFNTGVAACAFDRVHNRLYYTPMRLDQLRYIDLNEATPRVYFVQGKKMNPAGSFPQEGFVFTRMTIAADGNGYALTNDGTHLVQFTTDRNPDISDLGTITDNAKNAVSIHSQCSSWGGDMIADASGNLYLFTMKNNVFKIDIKSRIAEYLGQVKGVSEKFTTNGAAVDENGMVFLGSANDTESYRVNLKTMEATKVERKSDNTFNLSDLANGNLAFENQQTKPVAPVDKAVTKVNNGYISVYPNPVRNGSSINITFDVTEPGQYSILLVDVMGRTITNKEIKVLSSKQIETLSYGGTTPNGMYFVRVLNAKKEMVMSNKITIQ
jgi:Secretion system C-terminal sorting domain